MRKPGTDENDVRMSDVLCDFCGREWTEDVPMIEGHQGSCVCGRCLTIAYTELVGAAAAGGAEGEPPMRGGYACAMCLEEDGDRAALNREGEPGWRSPVTEVAMCRRCVKLAAGSLHKDPDHDWTRPGA